MVHVCTRLRATKQSDARLVSCVYLLPEYLFLTWCVYYWNTGADTAYNKLTVYIHPFIPAPQVNKCTTCFALL